MRALVIVLLAACTTSTPAESPTYTTQWRAAWYLATAYCQGRFTEERRAQCHNEQAYGWCDNGALGPCAALVTDVHLLDWCLGTVEPDVLPTECLELFAH